MRPTNQDVNLYQIQGQNTQAFTGMYTYLGNLLSKPYELERLYTGDTFTSLPDLSVSTFSDSTSVR